MTQDNSHSRLPCFTFALPPPGSVTMHNYIIEVVKMMAGDLKQTGHFLLRMNVTASQINFSLSH